ncbi:hypothetical protein AU074_13875 [Pseudomonas sp. ATCC PTA-122608]|uniref:hypothetical protein n=1 Tax=Pseudomonas sp. ATCC PTA-122608 TaxID=1771311 RepID=UPI00096BAAF6|nr:hypothetical protein [Pseudomonas sp. ATCC PTA-122608]OLY72259.1 hypothetical protein AU074_13875 [Pseudomonas sp. ATCC PTA-122608]
MSKDSKALVAGIFDQLRTLRETVTDLETVDEKEVISLRGAQTVDVDGAVHLSFMKLQDQIAAMEETLATIAEATGEIPKL